MKEERRSLFTYQVSIGNVVQIVVTILGLTGFYYDLKADVALIKQEQGFTKSSFIEMKESFKDFRSDVSLWEKEKNEDITGLKADVNNLKLNQRRK